MFNFKKIGKKVLSSVLGATLAMGGFLNTQVVKANGSAGYEINQEDAADQAIKQSIDNFTSSDEVCKAVKDFTADKDANFGRFNSIGKVSKIEFYNGFECKIATFGTNEAKKAIVGISVPDGRNINSLFMGVIICKLGKLGIKGVNEKDFKNVYLVIRSKKEGMKFCIDDIMRDSKNATTVVTPGATFKSWVKISENSKLTAPGAMFGSCVDISGGSTLDAPGATFGRSVEISGGSTLTARGATFKSYVKISENSTLTAPRAMFKYGAYISGGSKLIAPGATFGRSVEISGGSTLTAPGATFNWSVNVNGNNLTVDISNAKNDRYDSCKINAQNPQINLSGCCDFDKIIFGGECSNLEITVNDDEVDKFYQEYGNLSAGAFASINGESWEELKKKKEERKRREEEKRKKMEILKHAGIFGLKCIARVISIVISIIAFKDEIKSLSSSKKIVKTPATTATTATTTTTTTATTTTTTTATTTTTTTATATTTATTTEEEEEQEKTNNTDHNGNNSNNKSKGFVKKHPIISCAIGTLVTGIIVTPLVIFRNKIIKGIESIFGKNQNKKMIAKLKELKSLIN